MKLTESMPIRFGDIQGHIFGGPFRQYVPGTRRLFSVKMAQEIDHAHDVAVDTEDFSVPNVEDMQRGCIEAIKALSKGQDVYAGCMGGTGRTGTFMGCMAKAMMDHDPEAYMQADPFAPMDPVLYVRAHYRKHAIETRGQENYVRTFDTGPLLAALRALEQGKTHTVYVDRPVEVERIVYLGPVEWALAQWKAFFHPDKT